jgi:hypothetical protein
MQVVSDADEDDEDIQLVPVEMDQHTRRCLALFARLTGQAGTAPAAGRLLRDLLRDTEFWEAAFDEVGTEALH